MEINITLEQNGRQRLYEQIYMYLREEIRTGRLLKDEKLPSTRTLSEYLHISRSTAELAYEQLEAEGYIRIRKNSGAYVCGLDQILLTDPEEPAANHARKQHSDTEESAASHARKQLSDSEEPAADHARKQHSDTEESAADHARKQLSDTEESAADHARKQHNDTSGTPDSFLLQKTKAEAATVIDFSPRRIDMSMFPYATWRRITRNLMAYDQSDIFQRGDPQGDQELRETIVHYLHLSRGVRCSARQIIIGAGNDYLLMLLRYILGENRCVGMENPSYLRAWQVFNSMNYTVRMIRMDEAGMSAAALEDEDCDLAYVMPAHQFPAGIHMPYTRRLELLQWAAEKSGRYIIEDDYDSAFKYRGRPSAPLQSLDQSGSVIYIGSFSKSIAPAIRVSFMILPPDLIKEYHRKCGFVSSTVSRIDQGILNEFIRMGYFERYVNRMRKQYRTKHDLMLELLEPVSSKYDIIGEGAGLHLLLELKSEYCGQMTVQDMMNWETRMKNNAQKSGIMIYTMSEMCIPGAPLPQGQERRPTILLGYAALTQQQIRRGIADLVQILMETF